MYVFYTVLDYQNFSLLCCLITISVGGLKVCEETIQA